MDLKENDHLGNLQFVLNTTSSDTNIFKALYNEPKFCLITFTCSQNIGSGMFSFTQPQTVFLVCQPSRKIPVVSTS